jgi:hypothetical protein
MIRQILVVSLLCAVGSGCGCLPTPQCFLPPGYHSPRCHSQCGCGEFAPLYPGDISGVSGGCCQPSPYGNSQWTVSNVVVSPSTADCGCNATTASAGPYGPGWMTQSVNVPQTAGSGISSGSAMQLFPQPVPPTPEQAVPRPYDASQPTPNSNVRQFEAPIPPADKVSGVHQTTLAIPVH